MTTLNDLVYERLENHIKTIDENDLKIFYKLSLLIYQIECKETDLYMLANIISPKELIRLISYYDGDVMKLPSKAEFREAFFLTITFYLKEIKNMSWNGIKELLSLPEKDDELLSSIAMGRKISQIRQDIFKDAVQTLQDNISKEKLNSIIKELDDGFRQRKNKK